MGRGKKYTGSLGEEISLKFLVTKGYRILAKNYRTPFGEIDIVARHGDSTVFIEVKTRITSSLGPPCLSVTKEKERHLIKSALAYLKRYRLVDSFWRIDIVSVKLNYDYEVESIEIIENAVEEP